MENTMTTTNRIAGLPPSMTAPYTNSGNVLVIPARPVIDKLIAESKAKPPVVPKKPDPRDLIIEKFEIRVGANALPLIEQLSRIGYHGRFVEEIARRYQPLINSLNELAMIKVLTQAAASRTRLKLRRAIAQDLINALNIKAFS